MNQEKWPMRRRKATQSWGDVRVSRQGVRGVTVIVCCLYEKSEQRNTPILSVKNENNNKDPNDRVKANISQKKKKKSIKVT